MRRIYVCSECGARSTRKWNAARHINSVHGGAGTISAGSPTAGAVPESTPAFQSLPANGQGYGISTRIEERLAASIREKVGEISLSLDSNPYLNYYAFVCESCLTIEVLKSLTPISNHYCDNLWRLDFPSLKGTEQAIFETLNRRLPRHLLQILREVRGDGKIKLAALFPAKSALMVTPSEMPEMHKKCPQFAPHTALDLGNVAQNHWAHRAITNGETLLSDEEILSFLALTHSTFGIARIGTITPSTYALCLKIVRKNNSI